MRLVKIPTERGSFTVQVMGEHGPWVVCWPPQLNDGESLKDFTRLLARHHQVVVCDPPAMGLNQHLPYSNQISDLVYYAHRVLIKLGIEQYHWVGQSAGGVVGAALYGAAPELFRSLTLVSTPMLKAGRFKLHLAAATFLLAGFQSGRELLAARAAEEVGSADSHEYALVSASLRKALMDAKPSTIRAMGTLPGEGVRAVFERLRANPPPMLIISGRHDRIVLARDQHTVAELTHSKYVELKCGHLCLQAEPEKTAHAIEKFIHYNELSDSARQKLALQAEA
jgi:3-oxoadipate enol-lactonase